MKQPRIFRLSGDYEDPSYIVDDVPMLAANPMSDRVPLVFESAPSSAASAESTSDSSGPVCAFCGNARPTSGEGRCCEPIGADAFTQMFARLRERGFSVVPISSAEGSPAKTSPLPDADEDLPASDRGSSSSSPESLTLFSPMEASSSLRTYPDFFPPTVDEISPSFSRRWPGSGFTTSPGECWTADTSECPSGGGASSSLADVLEDEVAPRYFLSPRAAAGILRRAEKRGRELPSHLSAALEAVARMTTTDREAG